MSAGKCVIYVRAPACMRGTGRIKYSQVQVWLYSPAQVQTGSVSLLVLGEPRHLEGLSLDLLHVEGRVDLSPARRSQVSVSSLNHELTSKANTTN